jgi:L-seryl-tRNA(Ser) seleniumtransferase
VILVHSLADGGEGYDISARNGHWIHVAGVWDRDGIASSHDTLRLYVDGRERELPVLRMLTAGEEELSRRAEAMRAWLEQAGVDARVVRAQARAGGGSLPLLELDGPACAVDPGGLGVDELAARLRAGRPPLVGRASEGWLLLDPRTLTDAEAEQGAAAVAAALR